MKDFLRTHFIIIVFSCSGIAGGYLYWLFIGCESGACPIKSVWYLSALWGLAFGYLSGSILNDIILKIRVRKNGKPSDQSEGQ